VPSAFCIAPFFLSAEIAEKIRSRSQVVKMSITYDGAEIVDQTEEGTIADAPAPSVARSCANCGEPLAGDFCYRCGEKQPEARDLSVRHFLAETLNELTSVEHSKLFRTIYALLFKPGFLSVEYFAGRRTRYLKPLSLCLGVLALSVFAYSATKTVSMFNFEQLVQSEKETLASMGHTQKSVYDKLIERISTKRNLTREATIEAINERWSRNFSLLQVPEIALFALLLAVVYFFSGRYLVEHIVFSLHFLSFAALSTVLLWPIYLILGVKPSLINMIVASLKFLVDIAYMFFAVRVFYHEPFWKGVLRAPVLFAGYFVIYVAMFLCALVVTLVTLAR
jgi:hypothetical protein